jgi:lipoprotein-anchoring transpeptidase ErfK/SrfK
MSRTVKSAKVLTPMLAALGLFVLSQAAFSAPGGGSLFPDAPEVAGPASASPLAAAANRAAARRRLQRPEPFPPSLVARIRPGHSVALRARPGGAVEASLGAQTEFGSPRALSVARVRGRWLGLTTSARPNGKLAWVEQDDPGVRIGRLRHSLHVDLSRRRLELRRGGRLVKRLSVSIGRPGSPTPTGRFAVTDKLRGSRFGPYYGCCILALSGYQPHPPPGWRGGNRLAIHGTNAPGTIGTAASAGCLRGADAGLELLMRRVPLGTPVLVRR